MNGEDSGEGQALVADEDRDEGRGPIVAMEDLRARRHAARDLDGRLLKKMKRAALSSHGSLICVDPGRS